VIRPDSSHLGACILLSAGLKTWLLKLLTGSEWRVFLAVLMISARYGVDDAILSECDFLRLTGIPPPFS
jgi:hypothetical protein